MEFKINDKLEEVYKRYTQTFQSFTELSEYLHQKQEDKERQFIFKTMRKASKCAKKEAKKEARRERIQKYLSKLREKIKTRFKRIKDRLKKVIKTGKKRNK